MQSRRYINRVLSSFGILLFSLFTLHSFVACVDVEEYDNSRQGNFEALWRIIDEHYCFFDYKQQEYGLDWDAVYNKYRVRVNENMSTAQLFEVLADMLAELRDGHVNLSSPFDLGRNWNWHEAYPANFSDSLSRRYLGTDYRIAASMKYRILDDNIGYIYYDSFANPIGDGNLTEIIYHFSFCRGLIIDIRNNSGGLLTNAETIAARFIEEDTHVGYVQHKTGTGHNDFSPIEKQTLKPSAGMRWRKPVCVLTNRRVYSAANEFVKYMKCAPNAVIVGDKTGGGAGLPFTNSLPNGWRVRFSACPMYDTQGNHTEFGIEPDYRVSLSPADFASGEDTIIEYARKLIGEHR